LYAYAEALSVAGGPVSELLVHMPIVGQVAIFQKDGQ